ncbi:MAG: undecaprenyl/decaprenyl-phosphate alpha-N-acetylglucosaminyl 1-phosphate transferase [Actinomycetota bacterium]|nr:undecaprenyl/decaprenyl-phosphate alpha-N-acetylglucosaminyl 1-phosphate transferase [Actinomycetota bacterium]
MEDDALYAFLTAFAVSTLLTPLVARLARRVGAVDPLRDRGLAREATPLLGGLAMLVGVLAASALFLPQRSELQAVLVAAILLTLTGAVDDVREMSPVIKLFGQLVAALIVVREGIVVENFTLPFLGRVALGDFAEPVTIVGLVAVINAVNFSDGVDGLAAGVCAISGAAFAVIAFDLGKDAAGVLAAVTCGAALGFLVHNFHPASVFMGDAGSNLLGLLLGCVIVEGSLKTNAVLALVIPLVILAVPFLDTGFVLAKRMKYHRPVYLADANHFHHRFARIGFSQRRTVLYLYGWTFTMAAVAVALRFVPYSDDRGNFDLEWSIVMGALIVLALLASVYLVYVLEILKLRRFREREARGADPDVPPEAVDDLVRRDLETGEFPALR